MARIKKLIEPESGIVDDEYVAERVAAGELVSLTSVYPKDVSYVRPSVMAEIRLRVRNWQRPRKRQDVQ